MKTQKNILVFFFSLIGLASYSQNDSLTPKLNLYGNIFPAFYSTYGTKQNTFFAFEIFTAQVGFKTEIQKHVKANLLYNVTKTTSDIVVLDSTHKPLTVNFFKGSDYTAFLKEASISWVPSHHIELSIGQLISEQYLATQDKFWNSRYIAFTMQERFNFGFPADFGFRFAYFTEKLRLSTTISNGEGPLYKQDSKGLMMYALRIEYKPNSSWIVNYYVSIYPNHSIERWCHSFFVGFKKEIFRIGAEASFVDNDKWISTNNYKGLSAYFLLKLKKRLSLITREDYLIKATGYTNASFSIAGIEYEINPNLKVCVNQRLLNQSSANNWQSFLSVGYKF